MNNDTLPFPFPDDFPASKSPGDYWYRLHNWLQGRGWKERLSIHKWKDGLGDATTWHVVFTFDGEYCSEGEGGKLIDAKNNAARISFQSPILQRVS